MKAFLMHKDRDFDLQAELPVNQAMLIQDLELSTLINTMAQGDGLVFDLVKRALLLSLTDPDAIVFRQHVLADCLANSSTVRQIYQIAVGAVQAERRVWGYSGASPDSILSRAEQVIALFVDPLKRLSKISDEESANFRSAGFVRFFAMISKELGDEYLRTVEAHLTELKFRRGTLVSAQLGKGSSGTNYVLRRPREQSWVERVSPLGRSGHSFEIHPRDDAGFRVLAEMRGKGINLVANALAQAVEHIRSFFAMLMSELGFYIGCLNLSAKLAEKGEPTCFPEPLKATGASLCAKGLYDVCLTLHLAGRAVGNDVDAEDRWLVMITGANGGGKSTFLRSVGIAQLLMQCGAFVPARSFRGNVCHGVFTHFKREEDPTMRSGKLDEELSRMSDIADLIKPNCILLCNESFASTNEREGSEIGRQVISALTAERIRVFFVTHLFDLAQGFYAETSNSGMFLRAERLPDQRRTFRVREGEPLPTSYGEDSYRRIFRSAVQPRDGDARADDSPASLSQDPEPSHRQQQ